MEAVGARGDICWGEPVGTSTTLPHVYAIVSGEWCVGCVRHSCVLQLKRWAGNQRKEAWDVDACRSYQPHSYLVPSLLLQPEQNSTWGWAVETKDSSFLLGMACC